MELRKKHNTENYRNRYSRERVYDPRSYVWLGVKLVKRRTLIVRKQIVL
jgi:hypothetical protein